MIATGQYDLPVTFERVTETVSAIGGRAATWATLKSTMARMVATGGAESAANETQAVQTVTVAIRYQAVTGLSAKDRVTVRGVAYDISAVLPDPAGRPVELHITAQRRADA